MKAFQQLYLAGIYEFIRDRTALFWSFAFPIMFTLIFGIIFSNEDGVNFEIGIVDEDNGQSQMLVEAFRSIDAFEVTLGSRTDELDALKAGDRRAVIVIPSGTTATIGEYMRSRQDQQVALEVYYDPSNRNTAQVILNVIDQVVNGISQGMTGVKPLLTIVPQTVTSEELRSIDYLLPGILAMSIMQLGLFATAAPIVSLREKGVLRCISTTPVPRLGLIAAQVAMRLTIALAQTALIIVVGVLVFSVHIETDTLPALLGMMLLGALAFITFGYFLSTLANTEEAVMGIAQLPNMVFMFLSGIFFPIDFMPDWIRPLVEVIPLTYLGDAFRHLMVGGGSFYSMTTNIAVLVGWLVVSTGLAIWRFRWE